MVWILSRLAVAAICIGAYTWRLVLDRRHRRYIAALTDAVRWLREGRSAAGHPEGPDR